MKRLKNIAILICVLACAQNMSYAQGYTLPEFTAYTLDNGLTVYLMEQHDVPVISVSAILPGGAIYDGEKSGLAQLTALSLKHGTQKFSKAQIDESLDFIGANVDISASKEYVSLSSKFAEKDITEVMTIMTDLLLHPVFDKDEFSKEKSRALVELEQQKESPRAMIGDYFDQLLFGDHVYGSSLSGTIEAVEKLTVDDVKNFYEANYVPGMSAISIVGDFKTAEMKKLVDASFSSWKKGNAATKSLASKQIKVPELSNVLLVNKEDAKETTFYIGATGVARNNKDYVAIQVVNTLFGGRFTSMLNEELRINSGLTYGARSRFVNYKNGGSFYISTFTAKETTEQAMDLTLEVVNRLHSKGLDDKSLTSAKNYVKGQFPPRYETVGQLSDLLTKMFWYDFDESFINDFESNVDGLTLQKANKIIANYFPKDKFQIVMIGKASEIKEIATKFGKVEQVDIKD